MVVYEVTDVYSCSQCGEVEAEMCGEVFEGVALLSGNCPKCGEFMTCEIEMIGGN